MSLSDKFPKTCERYVKDIPGSTAIGITTFTIAKRAYNESMLERPPQLSDSPDKTLKEIEYNLNHRPIKKRPVKKRVRSDISWKLYHIEK